MSRRLSDKVSRSEENKLIPIPQLSEVDKLNTVYYTRETTRVNTRAIKAHSGDSLE